MKNNEATIECMAKLKEQLEMRDNEIRHLISNSLRDCLHYPDTFPGYDKNAKSQVLCINERVGIS